MKFSTCDKTLPYKKSRPNTTSWPSYIIRTLLLTSLEETSSKLCSKLTRLWSRKDSALEIMKGPNRERLNGVKTNLLLERKPKTLRWKSSKERRRNGFGNNSQRWQNNTRKRWEENTEGYHMKKQRRT
jgi:hypothetical protein